MNSRQRRRWVIGFGCLLLLVGWLDGRMWAQERVIVNADCSQEIAAALEGIPDCVLDGATLNCPPCPSPCPPPCEVVVDPASRIPSVRPSAPRGEPFRFSATLAAGDEIAMLGATWEREGRWKPFIGAVWTNGERVEVQGTLWHWAHSQREFPDWTRDTRQATAATDSEIRWVGGVTVGLSRR